MVKSAQSKNLLLSFPIISNFIFGGLDMLVVQNKTFDEVTLRLQDIVTGFSHSFLDQTVSREKNTFSSKDQ